MGLFSDRSDHPLAEAKSAREIFDRLGRSPPLEAIEELDTWLESLEHEEKLKPQRRIELLLQLDRVGLAAAGRLARDYLNKARSGRGQDYKLWLANRNYWNRLVNAYESVLLRFESDNKVREETRTSLPLLYLRLLRTYGGRQKWDQFRYGPIDPAMWQAAGRIYLLAVAAKMSDKTIDAGDGSASTISAEYLKLLLFYAASMDRLQPVEIELAERLLIHFLPAFTLTSQVRPENVYWVDAAKPLPPTRLAKLPEVTPTLRFFATANALTVIETLRDSTAALQKLPADINLGGQYPPETVTAVLQHLAAFCAPKPPMRSHQRLQVKSWMKVVNGFDATCVALQGEQANDSAGSWAVDDVSRGGMRAQITLSGNDNLGIGSLVAMRPDGGDNWLLGIVRRFSRENQTHGNVGIETVGRTPVAVRIDSSGLAGDGLLLDSALTAGTSALLAVAPGVWQDFKPLTFSCVGTDYRLQPLDEAQRGSDYVIGRYWVDVLR